METTRLLELRLKEFSAKLRSEVIEAGRLTVQAQLATLNDITKQWKHRVEFRVRVDARTGVTRFQLIAVGSKESLQIFNWVDLGTKPHVIRPRSPNKALVFYTPYSARTAPIANAKAGTGRYGGTKNIRRVVNHPGTEAREFIAFSVLETQEDFQARVQALIRKYRR